MSSRSTWPMRLPGGAKPRDNVSPQIERIPGPQALPAPRQQPKLLVVTCMDAGLDPHGVLGLQPGDAHIVSNAGGVVTADLACDIESARHNLGVERIVVLQHTDCPFLEGRLSAPGRPPADALQGSIDSVRRSMMRLTTSPTAVAPSCVAGAVYEDRTRLLWRIGRIGCRGRGRSPNL
jgi:carbonic anhydrase